MGSHKEILKNCNFVLKKSCSHVRIVPPTSNMNYLYLEENVSQAFRKAVMFTNYVKLKDLRMFIISTTFNDFECML